MLAGGVVSGNSITCHKCSYPLPPYHLSSRSVVGLTISSTHLFCGNSVPVPSEVLLTDEKLLSGSNGDIVISDLRSPEPDLPFTYPLRTLIPSGNSITYQRIQFIQECFLYLQNSTWVLLRSSPPMDVSRGPLLPHRYVE